MKFQNENDVMAAWADVVATAEGLRNGTVAFLEGVRRLVDLRHQVSRAAHDSDFMIFVAVDSETDHMPGAKVRELCAAEWLTKCDEDLRAYEARVRKQVDEACEVLARRFSTLN